MGERAAWQSKGSCRAEARHSQSSLVRRGPLPGSSLGEAARNQLSCRCRVLPRLALCRPASSRRAAHDPRIVVTTGSCCWPSRRPLPAHHGRYCHTPRRAQSQRPRSPLPRVDMVANLHSRIRMGPARLQCHLQVGGRSPPAIPSWLDARPENLAPTPHCWLSPLQGIKVFGQSSWPSQSHPRPCLGGELNTCNSEAAADASAPGRNRRRRCSASPSPQPRTGAQSLRFVVTRQRPSARSR